MSQEDRRKKAEQTTTVAHAIIDAERRARDEKTAKLKALREAVDKMPRRGNG